MNRRCDSIRSCAKRAAFFSAGALALLSFSTRAAATNPATSSTAGEKSVCATKPPVAMLDGAEPQQHAFHQFPDNRATESATFPDGAHLDVEVTGCAGPVLTKMVISLPAAGKTKSDKRTAERKSVGELVAFLSVNQDAFSRTPLGLPGPARALRAIDEGRMSYGAQDRLCFDKDDPIVVPSAQRCAKFLTMSWAGKAKKTFTIEYQAEP